MKHVERTRAENSGVAAAQVVRANQRSAPKQIRELEAALGEIPFEVFERAPAIVLRDRSAKASEHDAVDDLGAAVERQRQ
jgi:hypothetical protein